MFFSIIINNFFYYNKITNSVYLLYLTCIKNILNLNSLEIVITTFDNRK